MALNITTAVIGSGCNTATASPSLVQWDQGQILKIEGPELPDTGYQVEFSTADTIDAMIRIGTSEGVEIPNVLLQRSSPITAYIVLHEGEDDRETEYWITIYIKPRQQPETITPDPEEQSVIDQAIAALQQGVATAEEILQETDAFANAAAASAELSRSWAEGGTGSREGEDTDNAEYWANMAEQVAGQAGWVRFYIDDEGNLHYQKTENVALDFYIDANGILHVTGG